MKKMLFLLLASCGFFTAKAQDWAGFYIGVNTGYYFGDENADESEMKIGYQFGFLYNHAFTEEWRLQPEVNFMQVGARFEYPMLDDDVKWNLNYINVPVILQYHTKPGWYFEFGPQVGFLVSAKSKFGDNSTDIKDAFKSTDFGLNLGLGYRVSDNIRVGIRYYRGLADIAEDDDEDYKNAGLRVQLRVGIPIK